MIGPAAAARLSARGRSVILVHGGVRGLGAKRRSFEAGHRPKFLVVVDGTPEAGRAVRFAARRAARIGAQLIALGVVVPPDTFEWLGVGDALREEAAAEVEELLAAAAAQAVAAAGVAPERRLSEGDRTDAIAELIASDQDISFLVLATAPDGQDPGPLISAIASGSTGGLPVPVVIVPGDLSDEEIDALAG